MSNFLSFSDGYNEMITPSIRMIGIENYICIVLSALFYKKGLPYVTYKSTPKRLIVASYKHACTLDYWKTVRLSVYLYVIAKLIIGKIGNWNFGYISFQWNSKWDTIINRTSWKIVKNSSMTSAKGVYLKIGQNFHF